MSLELQIFKKHPLTYTCMAIAASAISYYAINEIVGGKSNSAPSASFTKSPTSSKALPSPTIAGSSQSMNSEKRLVQEIRELEEEINKVLDWNQKAIILLNDTMEHYSVDETKLISFAEINDGEQFITQEIIDSLSDVTNKILSRKEQPPKDLKMAKGFLQDRLARLRGESIAINEFLDEAENHYERLEVLQNTLDRIQNTSLHEIEDELEREPEHEREITSLKASKESDQKEIFAYKSEIAQLNAQNAKLIETLSNRDTVVNGVEVSTFLAECELLLSEEMEGTETS